MSDAPFTPAQEARIRELVAAQIDARNPAATPERLEAYRTGIAGMMLSEASAGGDVASGAPGQPGEPDA